MAGRENRSCAWQGWWGCWGMQGSRGAVGAGGYPGVWGQGTMTGLGEEQHAGESGPTRTRAMREGESKRWQKLAFLPQTMCLEPLMWAWGVLEGGCHPQPGQGGLVALHVGTWFPARGE